MLATKNGKCINFPISEIRVFASRASTGVRGIKLQREDEVISMTILDCFDTDTATRMAYLKKSKEKRGTFVEDDDSLEAEESYNPTEISDEKFNEMQEKEQFILTVSNKGFGKKTSSYEYRVTHRGGSGITNIKLSKKSNAVVAAFPILEHQQIILVTDAGKLIRIPTDSIRVAGRMTQGVTLFRVADNESVVSVAVIDSDDEETENVNNELPTNNEPKLTKDIPEEIDKNNMDGISTDEVDLFNEIKETENVEDYTPEQNSPNRKKEDQDKKENKEDKTDLFDLFE